MSHFSLSETVPYFATPPFFSIIRSHTLQYSPSFNFSHCVYNPPFFLILLHFPSSLPHHGKIISLLNTLRISSILLSHTYPPLHNFNSNSSIFNISILYYSLEDFTSIFYWRRVRPRHTSVLCLS